MTTEDRIEELDRANADLAQKHGADVLNLTAQLQAAQEELAQVRSAWQVQTADWSDQRRDLVAEIERLRGAVSA